MRASRLGITTNPLLTTLLVFATATLMACSGTANIDFEGDGGAGSGNSGTGAGASGSGGSGAGGTDPSCFCEAPSFPVCGVDGDTYDAACGAHCVPVDIACDGACPCRSCDDIALEYRALLEQARQCSADLAMPQCTEKVLDGLPCGCPTFVNPQNTEAYQAMLGLLQKWEQLGCAADVLCEACLEDPTGGRCSADSGRVDTCVDVLN
jgi:hypothetical protein